MKKVFISLTAMCIAAASFAQNSNAKKQPSLGLNFFLTDYSTPNLIKATSVSNVISKKTYAKPGDMSPGLSISYLQGITDHIDFMALLGGSFTKYSYKSKVFSQNEGFVTSLDAQANFKLLTDQALLVPYLSTGVGLSVYNASNVMAHVPVGGGLQLNIGDGSFLYLQSIYKYGITKETKDNLNFSFGVASAISQKAKPIKKVTPPPPPPVVEKDTDADGIVDGKDKCPTVAGLAKYEGCPIPDTDKDGINDEEDKCPTVAGSAKYKGCPIPDTDKDGINDEEDKCPTIMGLARYNGCPIPDSDGDNVNDEEDKCPTVAGVKENAGCPEIQTKLNQLAQSVLFAAKSSVIASNNFKALDEVAEILKKYPNTKLTIEGHTDNTGKAIENKKLSQLRADAIKVYFEKKGIEASRLIANGYGSEKPIADNKTPLGRTQNRRVEMKATY